MTVLTGTSKTLSSRAVEGCNTCKFCKGGQGPTNEINWFCAIRAPTGMVIPGPQSGVLTLSVMPPLPSTKWCGEWQSQGEAANG